MDELDKKIKRLFNGLRISGSKVDRLEQANTATATSLVKVEVDSTLFISEGDSQPVVIYTASSNIAVRGIYAEYSTQFSYDNNAGSINTLTPSLELGTLAVHTAASASISLGEISSLILTNNAPDALPQVILSGQTIVLSTGETTDNSAPEDFWTLADAGLLTFWFDIVEIN